MRTLTNNPELIVEDRLLSNGILMVKRLKEAGDYVRAELLIQALHVRRNQMLIALAASLHS